jgi:hypothetical protein
LVTRRNADEEINSVMRLSENYELLFAGFGRSTMTVDDSMIQDNISLMKKRRVGSLTAEGVALMRAGEAGSLPTSGSATIPLRKFSSARS